MLGWPYETGVTLARLVFSGIMDRYPDLKVIAHHLGGVIPYLEGRVAHSFDQLGARTSDEDYGAVLRGLKKRPYDYFKDFYGDTAVEGARAATVCGIDFFTPDHVLFASDCPFDKEKGPGYIRDTIKVIDSLGLAPADKEKICWRNAERMFGLAAAGRRAERSESATQDSGTPGNPPPSGRGAGARKARPRARHGGPKTRAWPISLMQVLMMNSDQIQLALDCLPHRTR